MRAIASGVAMLAAALLPAPWADAGLLDSPPPLFAAAQGVVLYRMGPVHYRPGETDTIIRCTNVDSISVDVAVELFDQQDHPVGPAGRASLPVGGSVNFVTSAAVSVGERVVIDDLPPFDFGKARVSASAAGLSCVGFHRLSAADGSIREMALELVKRVPQFSSPSG